ncbi:hypothetical protein F4809DRAFT_659628 [Biscogniauxia mediterranea]|nr:hypothetical protein F4809DRAFT_659628 [Biscogniauxia mediterranea]
MDYNQKYAARAASTPLTPEELGSPGPARRHFPPRSIRFAALRRDVSDRLGAQSRNGAGAVHWPDIAGRRHGYTDRRLGCYVYRTWHALHGGRPNLQQAPLFFAKALLRVPESEATSWSVPGPRRRPPSAMRCAVTAGGGVFPPLPVETAQTWCEHGSSLRHLLRAVVLAADASTCCPWSVRRPVSFERADWGREVRQFHWVWKMGKLAKEFGVVRVKIFLFDLQAEEEAAIPSLRQASAMLTEERERACHAWVESVLQYASLREVGVDGNHFTLRHD